MEIKVVNLERSHFEDLKKFTDEFIGQGYYSLNQLEEILDKSTLNGHNCSFIIFQNGVIKGIRLSYMPNKWHDVKGLGGLTPDQWGKLKLEDLGYFQSLFLHPDLMNQSWAPVLSNLSVNEMKKAGAKGILTHSWLESPKNSSRIYLEKIGFKLVKQHQNYWINVDYECPRCGKPCRCTAGEMLKVIR